MERNGIEYEILVDLTAADTYRGLTIRKVITDPRPPHGAMAWWVTPNGQWTTSRVHARQVVDDLFDRSDAAALAQPAPPPAAPRGRPEGDFEDQVVTVAKLRGWKCFHQRDSRMQFAGKLVGDPDAKGWPDWVFVRGPRMVIAELKAAGKSPTPEQREWLAALRGVPALEVHLWRPKDFDTIVQVLQ